ncbi:MAG: MmgE/PrpD family protein [Alphaproteobacteria bacterium]|nr:MmgE/PrpD family protein [Alphaproteobacteria bacterium]
MMDLARSVLALDAAQLPAAVVAQAKLLILDSIGCGLIALADETVHGVLSTVEELGGAPQSTVLGREEKTSVLNAVLANGTLIRVFDLNDFIIGKTAKGPVIGGHPSDNIAVALAVGEWQQRSGLDVIAAIVIGYEIYSRLKDLMIRTNPWDGTTVSGVAAAAIAGRILGLDEVRLAHAMALGAARAPTSSIVRGGMVSAAKSISNPLIAQSGTLAALLAARGVTGPLAIFDDPRGLYQVFDCGPALDALTRAMADTFAIMNANIKAYPCLATGQTAVAAALKMHEALGGRTDSVARIEVIMADYPFVERQQSDQDRRRPSQREAADHSFYFLVAVALMDGAFTARQFDGERWADPAIRALMDRITMHRDASWNTRAPDSYPCTMRVVTQEGEEHLTEAAYPPGFSKSGLDAATVMDKFDRVTAPLLAKAEQDSIKDAIMELDALPSIAVVMEKFARGTGEGNEAPCSPLADEP